MSNSKVTPTLLYLVLGVAGDNIDGRISTHAKFHFFQIFGNYTFFSPLSAIIDNTVWTWMETYPHTAMDETEKYTNVCVILAQLRGVMAAGTENRRDKVHTLQLEGCRSFISCCFTLMLLRLENAATM